MCARVSMHGEGAIKKKFTRNTLVRQFSYMHVRAVVVCESAMCVYVRERARACVWVCVWVGGETMRAANEDAYIYIRA